MIARMLPALTDEAIAISRKASIRARIENYGAADDRVTDVCQSSQAAWYDDSVWCVCCACGRCSLLEAGCCSAVVVK